MTIKDVKHFVKANLASFAILLAVILTVYFSSLFNGFVSADDLEGYVNNPKLLNFSHYLQSLSPYYISLSFWKVTVGNNPFFLHLNSLVLHILMVFLVYIFVRLTFGRKIALPSALIFSVHPAISEAVLWISGAGYLHQGLVSIITLILFALYRRTSERKYLFICYAFLALGLFIYKSAYLLTIPFILTILEVFIYENSLKTKSVAVIAPFLIIGAISFAMIFTNLQEQRLTALNRIPYVSLNSADSAPWLNRLPYSYFMVFSLLVFPYHLALFHEGYVLEPYYYVIMILITVASIPLFFIIKKKNRQAAGLFLAIVAAILPIFTPVQVAFLIAERYLYVSAVFYSILLTFLLLKIKSRKNFVLALSAIVLVFGIRTFVRSFDWKNSLALWGSNARLAPQSARVFNNLGDAYAKEINFPASVAAFQWAIQLQPRYTDAIHNLGNTYIDMGQYGLAKEQFEKALEIDPNYAGAAFARDFIQKVTMMQASQASPQKSR